MDVWIQGLRPARLLLALGVIAWLAGMLRPDGSLAGASTMSFTILHLAPLGIAVAAAGAGKAGLAGAAGLGYLQGAP